MPISFTVLVPIGIELDWRRRFPARRVKMVEAADPSA
jgi:hypothetical protein